MKKVISFCLIIFIIMSNLNFETVEALSNKINEVYTTLTQTESEETNVKEDKDIEAEETNNSKDEKSESNKTSNLENKEAEVEGPSDLEDEESESEKIDDLEDEEKNTSDEKEAEIEKSGELKDGKISSYSNQPSSVSISNGTYNRTLNALESVIQEYQSNTLLQTGTLTIKFLKDYSITSQDANAIRFAFKNDRLIFEAVQGVTVTVTEDLELYHNDMNYVPSYSSAKVITFQNIKLNFTAEHSIFANGTWLHMGKNVEMVGQHYPKIFMGSKTTGNAINEQVRAIIESGKYSEISASSGENGRRITSYGAVYFLGGYAKKIVSGKNNKHEAAFFVEVFSGEIDEVINMKLIGSFNANIRLKVGGSVTIKRITDAGEVEIGFYDYVNGVNQKFFPGELIVTDSMKFNGTLGMERNCVLEIGEMISSVEVGNAWFREGSTIRVPGNRSKDNIPLILKEGVSISTPINLELSTDTNTEEFYLMKVYNKKSLGQSYYKISEDQYFYLDKIEDDTENGMDVSFLKAKAKEKGSLIYDTKANEFLYTDIKGQEKSAWWINNKINDGSLNFSNTWTYDDLAKHEYNYVLSPALVTFIIRGDGGNNTLKFSNDRHSDRKFNIKFENLNSSNSEFVFENINSIIVNGVNSITQDNPNKTALKYSFTGNTGNAVSFTNESSIFVVYNKDSDANRYSIKDNIINASNSGSESIINMSFEETPSSNENLQLYTLDNSGKPKRFSTKIGYDELTILSEGDDKDYYLTDADNTKLDNVYYYQSDRNKTDVKQNSGPIGTKFTTSANGTKNYYKVNNKARVHVVANKNGQKYYYLWDNLAGAMQEYVAHQNAIHEVVFLGDYEITVNDVNGIKIHNGNTNGITFKTKVDDWKYTLKINYDIEFKVDNDLRKSITFNEIKFNYQSSGKWIYGNGRTLTFGDDVEMEGSNYPSVSGGQPAGKKGTLNQSNVTIKSGTYEKVIGNLESNKVRELNLTINNGTFKSNVFGDKTGTDIDGSLNMKIYGGTFEGEVSAIDGGTVKSATLTIANGTFKSNVSVAKTGSTVKDTLTLKIDGGTFDGEVIGSDGATANVTLIVNNGTFTNKVAGLKANANLSGNLNMNIKTGTFNGEVIGSEGATANNVTLTIDGGTFNGEVSGISGGTANTATVTITNGTFKGKVSGAKAGSTVNGDLNLKIDAGTFNDVVVAINGAIVKSNSKLTITNGTFKNKIYGINFGGSLTGNFDFQIDNGTFENTVRGVDLDATRGIFKRFIFGNNMRGALNGTLNIKINNGTFSEQVQGISSGADNATVNLEISGGNFNHNVVALGKSTKNGTTDMKITGGTYNAQVVGQYSDNSNFSAKSVVVNIEGGTFNDLIYGAVLSDNTTINVSGGTFNSGSKLNAKSDRGGNSTININDNISVQEIGNFDKLVVGENKKSTLTVKKKIIDGANNGNISFKSELLISNDSEVKLEGTDQSQVKKLTLDGSGNVLTLAMDRATAPLMVKEVYEHAGNKLTLNTIGVKTSDRELIKFSSSNGDAINFDFKDQNYYIREIDNASGNGSGNTIKIYEKMNPNSLAFKVDIDGNTLQYSNDNGTTMKDVWWYKPSLSNQNINFLEDDMFKYKGMELFKNMNSITSGNKIFEITNSTVDSKNISIDLGAGTNFDLKLNNSKLTDSTLTANNIKDLVLEGANSISELSGTKNPFDANISGEVKATNDKSYLSIFTDESNLPFSSSLVNGRRDVARVIDFKFREDFKSDENLRLVANGGGSELVLTVPNGTGRLGVVFGKNNANQTYNLYHGANGNTGTSVYVSGNTDKTFNKSFTTSSNDNVTAYEYVRRAKPVNKVSTNITNQFSFSIDTQTSGLTGINPNNWNKYFNAKDVSITNNSIVAEDEFTDDQGVTYHFGKTNSDIELGYLGVSASNAKKNDMQLVDSSALDSNITNIASGAKVALKLGIGQDVVPLDENNTQSTNPLKKWTIPSSATEILKIQPNFNSSDIFFNVSYNANSTLNSSHNITYKFGLLAP